MSADGSPMSPADKKRNKLGYHRTAVACGHCRRRKIRCIPAFEDPAGRCQNCIRLKKDCQFFPVDQQNPPPGKRARSGTKTEGVFSEGDASVASSSPGGILRSSSFERIEGDGHLDTPPMASDPGYHGFHPATRSVSSTGFEYQNPYDRHQQQHGQVIVPSPYLSQSPRPYANESMNPGYYQPYANPVAGSYSSAYTSGSTPSNMTTISQESTYNYPTAPLGGAYSWGGPPTRSMSGSESEQLHHGFPAAFRTHTYPSFERETAGNLHQMPAAEHAGMPVGIDSSHDSVPPNYREPTSYQPIQIDMRQEWSGGVPDHVTHLPGPGAPAYPQGWDYSHQSEIMNARDEREHSHVYPSQSHTPGGAQQKPP
ncbi:hypothetical protein LTR10_015571 [Elasticomyces elasticus]|uniref:Zn(2)-C6 fungal-type domain-containing protein n=1 Tax=Exophiala sideris TaxID=1016849 RepID=A0ABR0JLK8_9EURO|nr:hypothetical protein LTR10_015571 [Elasticomyces elasticus]KAK5032283.1 hypothetical protein LTR13_007501 [Exophiala sideris]KAK5036281.1 hypothetical protein LTS07_002007 [Exophiala sideris]KAK5066664.1 hypothetical protein LTR69_002011 [Exophiala sideris]KAK5180486.1 hypothetical protein LTR44_007244 [Eurotiomycetes sp. CCFEE 6388]